MLLISVMSKMQNNISNPVITIAKIYASNFSPTTNATMEITIDSTK